MISPSFITRILFASAATTPRSWLTSKTDVCVSSAIRFRRSKICRCTVTSRAVVGSSAINSDGRHANAIASTIRCCCPPESSNGYRFIISSGFRIPVISNSFSACSHARFRLFFFCCCVAFSVTGSGCRRIVSINCLPTLIVGFR